MDFRLFADISHTPFSQTPYHTARSFSLPFPLRFASPHCPITPFCTSSETLQIVYLPCAMARFVHLACFHPPILSSLCPRGKPRGIASSILHMHINIPYLTVPGHGNFQSVCRAGLNRLNFAKNSAKPIVAYRLGVMRPWQVKIGHAQLGRQLSSIRCLWHVARGFPSAGRSETSAP